MLTLGIETSCDETSCAILKDKRQLLSNVISSSLEHHKEFGGVVPEIASRHTLENIDIVFNEALKKAKVKAKDIDLIAVTHGPGLIGSLLVGISFAKSLSYSLKIPLVGINHLEAHLEANFIEKDKPRGAFVGLVVSGGHTSLVYQKKGHYQLIGSTVDDAIGEAYDKCAKILELGYPGGPEIDKIAKKGKSDKIVFTKPKQKSVFDFSFSGIKTAVLYYVKKNTYWKKEVADIAASFQHAVISWLVEKTFLACEKKKAKTIVIGGGVSANSLLREWFTEESKKKGIKLYLPPIKLTNDNAAMTARLGYERYLEGGCPAYLRLVPDPNLKIGLS